MLSSCLEFSSVFVAFAGEQVKKLSKLSYEALLLSIESWLFNRDSEIPITGYNKPYNIL